jgi:hypothetical protein
VKFGDLTSIAHNIAVSVSDGASFLFGRYGLDIHGEALGSAGGRIVVDFLSGRVIEGEASEGLRSALADSPAVLAELGGKHGAVIDDFKVLEARYGVDQAYGPHFTVIVEDQQGRRSEELYQGISGRKMRRGHEDGT